MIPYSDHELIRRYFMGLLDPREKEEFFVKIRQNNDFGKLVISEAFLYYSLRGISLRRRPIKK